MGGATKRSFFFILIGLSSIPWVMLDPAANRFGKAGGEARKPRILGSLGTVGFCFAVMLTRRVSFKRQLLPLSQKSLIGLPAQIESNRIYYTIPVYICRSGYGNPSIGLPYPLDLVYLPSLGSVLLLTYNGLPHVLTDVIGHDRNEA